MQFPVKSPYKPETAQKLVDGHADFMASNDDDTLREIKALHIQKVAKDGIPTPRLERWKYTNIIPAIKTMEFNKDAFDYKVTKGEEFASDLMEHLDDKDIQSMMSDIPAAWDRYEDAALISLANAYMAGGLVIEAPKGKSVEDSIELEFTAEQDGVSSPRLVIFVRDGAELTIKENHIGAAKGWNNGYTQIVIGKNASLKHYTIQEYGTEVVYTQNTHVTIDRDGKYEAFTLVSGGAITRNQIHVEIQGENAECFLNGMNLLKDKQHSDVTYTMDHQAPHCHSDQFIRSVLDNQAKGVFQGKVHVYQEAQKTDAYQMANALLLSEGAEMDTKPELEIYADDVSCSHGTTTGQIDEDPMFYLRSRGLTEEAARALLIEAFLGEATDRISDESFQELCNGKAQEWLKNNG